MPENYRKNRLLAHEHMQIEIDLVNDNTHKFNRVTDFEEDTKVLYLIYKDILVRAFSHSASKIGFFNYPESICPHPIL